MGFLYGRAGGLTTENGGFRPGQTAVCTELLGSGANSCEADFCAEGGCPLTHHSGRNR